MSLIKQLNEKHLNDIKDKRIRRVARMAVEDIYSMAADTGEELTPQQVKRHPHLATAVSDHVTIEFPDEEDRRKIILTILDVIHHSANEDALFGDIEARSEEKEYDPEAIGF